jgi:hypothetical protein
VIDMENTTSFGIESRTSSVSTRLQLAPSSIDSATTRTLRPALPATAGHVKRHHQHNPRRRWRSPIQKRRVASCHASKRPSDPEAVRRVPHFDSLPELDVVPAPSAAGLRPRYVLVDSTPQRGTFPASHQMRASDRGGRGRVLARTWLERMVIHQQQAPVRQPQRVQRGVRVGHGGQHGCAPLHAAVVGGGGRHVLDARTRAQQHAHVLPLVHVQCRLRGASSAHSPRKLCTRRSDTTCSSSLPPSQGKRSCQWLRNARAGARCGRVLWHDVINSSDQAL